MHYTQTNINYADKTRALLQTVGGKDESNIAYIWKSQRTPQGGTQNAKTHNKDNIIHFLECKRKEKKYLGHNEL